MEGSGTAHGVLRMELSNDKQRVKHTERWDFLFSEEHFPVKVAH